MVRLPSSGPAAGLQPSLLVLTALIAALLAAPALAFTPSGLLEIHAINVQQGSAVLVVGPDGTTLLLDAGDNGKGVGEVVPYLRSLGLEPGDGLDYTVASHLHDDHVGGLDEVLNAGYDVREGNYFNGSLETGATIEDYRFAALLTRAGPPVPAPLGGTLDLGDGATATVVAVGGRVLDHGPVAGAEANENDLSVALLIHYGTFDYLWAGDLGGGDDDAPCTGRSTGQVDLETPLAEALVAGGSGALVPAGGLEVLHVNHHGSESSTNSHGMNLLQPEVAVISVGAGQHPSWHHPRRDVVEQVLLAQAPCVTAPPALVLQTEEGKPLGEKTSQAGYAVGDVVITTDGTTYQVDASGAVSQGPDERAAAGLPRALPEGCTADATTLCLTQGRFRVTLHWWTAQGTDGSGKAQPMTADTGYFWFFEPTNVEVVVKVLDACPVDQHFWVFAAGMTDVKVELTVEDTVTGAVRRYGNPQRTAFQPVQHTAAFSCGGQPPQAGFSASCCGHTCDFKDESGDPDGFVTAWSWSFGDGAASTLSDPMHRYGADGTYSVALEVTDDDGLTGEVTHSVRVPDGRPASTCCRICTTGKACGDSCISITNTCHQPRGCACNDWEVCS